MMKEGNRLKFNILPSRSNIFQYLCFLMVSFFSFLPMAALVSPGKHGSLFIKFGAVEIFGLGLCLIFFIVTFAHSSIRSGFKLTAKEKLNNLKEFFSTHKEALFLLIMYILVVISAVFVSGTERSLRGSNFRPDGVYMYTVLFALYFFGLMLKNNTLRKIVIGFYIFNFLICALVMIQQYLGILGSANAKYCPEIAKGLANIYDRLGFRIGHFYKGETASFYNLNHMGYYSAMGASICTAFFYKTKNPVSSVLTVFLCVIAYYTLIVNNTFGCFLAVSITLVFFAFVVNSRCNVRFLKAFLPVIIFAVVCVGVTLNPLKEGESIIFKNFSTVSSDVKEISEAEKKEEANGGSGRWKLWVNTVDMIREKPLLGYGPDNLKKEYTERNVKLDRCHCEVLEHSVSTGIPSAILYFSAIAYAVFVTLKKRNLTEFNDSSLAPLMAVCAYSISAMVGVFLFYTASHFIVMLGLMRD